MKGLIVMLSSVLLLQACGTTLPAGDSFQDCVDKVDAKIAAIEPRWSSESTVENSFGAPYARSTTVIGNGTMNSISFNITCGRTPVRLLVVLTMNGLVSSKSVIKLAAL